MTRHSLTCLVLTAFFMAGLLCSSYQAVGLAAPDQKNAKKNSQAKKGKNKKGQKQPNVKKKAGKKKQAKTANQKAENKKADSTKLAPPKQVTKAPPIKQLNFQQMKSFLNEYCIDCHGERKQKGDHRFDDLSDNFADAVTAERWQEVLDQINLGDMPPEDEPQPSFAVKRNVIAWMTGSLAKAREHAASSATGTALRRMTNHEYNNTIRDLFRLNIGHFNPSESFPKENADHGLENNAHDLMTSDYLLDQYLQAADNILDKAIVDPDARPESKRHHFSTKDLNDARDTYPFHKGYQGSAPFIDIMSNVPPASRTYAKKLYKGVRQDGKYRISFKAQLVYPKGKDPKYMQIIAANSESGSIGRPGVMDKELAVFHVTEKTKSFTFETWLDKGVAPVLYFMNGGGGGQPRIKSIAAKKEGLKNAQFFNTSKINKDKEYYVQQLHKGERIRLYSMSIEGPILESWPPYSHRVIYGEDGNMAGDFNKAKERLFEFAAKAYRRMPMDGELDGILNLVQAQMQSGMSYKDGVRLGVKAILASPGFIYIQQNDGELDDYALAARLSYFLWNSKPDETLLKLASQKQLKSKLAEQAERMLQDERSWSFVTNFTSQWLRTNKLGEMPPDMQKFRPYYNDNLEDIMKEETYRYFQHVLKNNLPIRDFISSNYTFLNSRLANLYKIPGVSGDKIRLVKLPANSVRGGVITHASVLTATSNGVETSPVTRGIWMLEALLGTPPTPPPPDVEPLDPDIRGATTIRQQLARHREIETCNDCHRKIDPYGFLMESFDPIGRYRTHYMEGKWWKPKKGKPVDTADTLPDGAYVKNIQQLKKHLLKKQHLVANGLSEHLLAYALARPVTFREKAALQRIVSNSKADGYKLRDIILGVVTDPVFSKR